MLYVNNKFFNLDERVKDDEFIELRKDLHKKVSALKQRFGDWITLRSSKQPERNSSGLLEPWQNITVPLKQIVNGTNGSEEWLYTESLPQIKDGYVIPDSLQEIVRYGELRINLNDQPDKAYFYMYKHDFVKRGKLVLVDLQSDEERRAAQREREAELNFYIYNKASSLNQDAGLLRVVARRWGVVNTNTLSDAQIKNTLYDLVMEGERQNAKDGKTRGIHEFGEDCKVDNSVKIGSVVQEAMDEGFLVFVEETRQWCIDYKDGGNKPVLLAVSSQEVSSKREALIAHLSIDLKALQLLENVMGRDLSKEASPLLPVNVLERTDDFQILKQQAKSIGINSFGMKKEDLKALLLEKAEALQQE